MTETVRPEPSRLFRWVVLIFISLTMFGNYYVYDCIAPLADLVSERIYNVLFLCTGNSARSILRRLGSGARTAPYFRAFSAGSQPKGKVNPFAVRVLENLDYPTDDLRSEELGRVRSRRCAR